MTGLTKQIPPKHVMLIYWVRMPNDARHTASSTGWVIVPAKGAINRAEEIDTFGDRELHDNKGRGRVVAGHGITILWPSGRKREVRSH